LRSHDFGASFRWELLEPLVEFAERWDIVDCQFHDAHVEAARQHLMAASLDFVYRLNMESGSDGHGWSSVVPVIHRDTFRIDGNDVYVQRVEAINGLATRVYDAHQTLIGEALRRLAR
jgi:hypothetical protein